MILNAISLRHRRHRCECLLGLQYGGPSVEGDAQRSQDGLLPKALPLLLKATASSTPPSVARLRLHLRPPPAFWVSCLTSAADASRDFEVIAFPVFSKVLPWVQILDPSFRRLSSSLPYRGIRDPEPPPVSQSAEIPRGKWEPRSIDHFAVLPGGRASEGTARRPMASPKAGRQPLPSPGAVQTPWQGRATRREPRRPAAAAPCSALELRAAPKSRRRMLDT